MSQTGKFELIPVEKVNLDKKNPRIRKFLEMYGDSPTPEQMYLALGAGSQEPEGGNSTTFQTLKESIKTNGSIVHPIIVNKDKEGEFVVIEGNTRVAIYRKFKEENEKGNWDLIPAMIHEDLPEGEKDSVRLQAHLVGPRPWDPYSKAKYLFELRNVNHLTWNQIVDYSGGKKKELENFIAAYQDMEKYYRDIIPDDSSFDTTRFSGFVELQKPNVKEAIYASNFTCSDFARWIDERLIDPLNTVRQLPRILKNDKSKEVFLKNGAKEAIKLLEIPPPDVSLKDATIESLIKVLTEKIGCMSWSEVKNLKDDPESAKAQLYFELLDEVSGVCKEINDNP